MAGMWQAFPTNRKEGFSVFVVIASPFLLAGFDFFFLVGEGALEKVNKIFGLEKWLMTMLKRVPVGQTEERMVQTTAV